jgi:hypothetical protein
VFNNTTSANIISKAFGYASLTHPTKFGHPGYAC